MGISFGALPGQAPPSLDALLAQLGIGGAGGPPAPAQPDPSDVLRSLGIGSPTPLDSSSGVNAGLLAGIPTSGPPPMSSLPGLTASPAPAPAAPPPAPAAAPPAADPGMAPMGGPPAAAGAPPQDPTGLPPPPTWKPRNVVGDVLDRLFLGGAIEGVRNMGFKHQVDAYNLAAGRAALAREIGAINALPQSVQPMATLAPKEFVTEYTKPVTTPEGATSSFADGRQFTAPKMGFDPVSGLPYTQTPGATAATGPALPGAKSIDAPSGAVIDSRTGPTGQAVGGDYAEDASGNVVSKRTGQPTTPVPVWQQVGMGVHGSFVGSPGAGGATPAGGAAPGGAAASLPALAAGFRILESGGRDMAAQNGSSTGRYQFKPATFYRVLPNGDINNPADQDKAFALLANENAGALQKAGIPVTNGSLYVMHQQGAPGALALMQADPGANAVQVLQQAGIYKNSALARRAITQNGGTAQMSAGEFVGKWNRLAEKSVKRAGGGAAAPAASASDPSAAPAAGAGGLPSTLDGGSMGAPHAIAGQRGLFQTGPDGMQHKIADPDFTPQDLAGMRDRFAGSDVVKEANAATTALNGFRAAKAQMQRNGVIDNAAMDSYLRGINPGMGARSNSIQLFMDHLGLPQELQAKIQHVTGTGFLTPATLNQMEQVMGSYAGAHVSAAQARADSDARFAGRYGYKPEDLQEQVPSIAGAPPAPAPGRGPPQGGQPAGGGQAGALLAQARAAIAKGAPAAAVRQRLQSMGVNPGQL